MNKKGFDYALLLWIVVVMGILLLYATLQSRIFRTGTIGEVEVPLLRIPAERAFLDKYIAEAAKLSMPDATVSASGDCTYANTKDKPTILTMELNITAAATEGFNRKMNEYLAAYAKKTKQDLPLSNYELYLTQGTVEGIAIQPTILPLKDFTGKTIGTWAYRPNFKIKYDHKFEEYPQIKAILELMAKECSDTEKPEECAKQKIPAGWTMAREQDEYTILARAGDRQPCYIIYLPEKTTAPTT